MAAGEKNRIEKRFLPDFYRFLNDIDRFYWKIKCFEEKLKRGRL